MCYHGKVFTFGEKMNNEDFRQQISNQLSAVTGRSDQDCQKIIFDNMQFNDFDDVYGEPKLDLVRSQLMFFEAGVLSNDAENAELLKEMLTEAQQTIFDYATILLKSMTISKDEFKRRAIKFIEATTNKNLKEQATLKTEKILGEEIVLQNA